MLLCDVGQCIYLSLLYSLSAESRRCSFACNYTGLSCCNEQFIYFVIKVKTTFACVCSFSGKGKFWFSLMCFGTAFVGAHPNPKLAALRWKVQVYSNILKTDSGMHARACLKNRNNLSGDDLKSKANFKLYKTCTLGQLLGLFSVCTVNPHDKVLFSFPVTCPPARCNFCFTVSVFFLIAFTIQWTQGGWKFHPTGSHL